MTTITDGTTTIAPALVLGYDTAQPTRNVFHDILGRPDPDVSLAPAALRSGTLSLLFLTAGEAQAARAVVTDAVVLTLTDVDVPETDMRFVVSGDIATTLDTETYLWTIDVPYREVAT